MAIFYCFSDRVVVFCEILDPVCGLKQGHLYFGTLVFSSSSWLQSTIVGVVSEEEESTVTYCKVHNKRHSP